MKHYETRRKITVNRMQRHMIEWAIINAMEGYRLSLQCCGLREMVTEKTKDTLIERAELSFDMECKEVKIFEACEVLDVIADAVVSNDAEIVLSMKQRGTLIPALIDLRSTLGFRRMNEQNESEVRYIEVMISEVENLIADITGERKDEGTEV